MAQQAPNRVTVAAMSLALVVMTLYSGLVKGYLKGSERNLLDLELGDVQIHAREYSDDPSIYSKMDDARAVVRQLRDSTLFRYRNRPACRNCHSGLPGRRFSAR